MSKQDDHKGRVRVYVWEFPVRLAHWVNVLSIITFAITGLYIGEPYIRAYAETQFVMSYMRFFHFVALALRWSLCAARCRDVSDRSTDVYIRSRSTA